MKTTVKLSPSKSITVEPAGKHCDGGIIATLNFEVFGIKSSEAMTMTPDQCGALLFGMEQALGWQEPPAQTTQPRKVYGRQEG